MPRQPQLPCDGGRKRDRKESEAEATRGRASLSCAMERRLERQKASSIEQKARASERAPLPSRRRLVARGASQGGREMSHLCLSGAVAACEGGALWRDEVRKERAGGDGEKKESKKKCVTRRVDRDAEESFSLADERKNRKTIEILPANLPSPLSGYRMSSSVPSSDLEAVLDGKKRMETN